MLWLAPECVQVDFDVKLLQCFHHIFDSMHLLIFPSVRMEDVVYDGWDISVAHTVSLQVISPCLSHFFCINVYFQIQCQRCKCRLAIVFPPEGVPSLDMLLDTGSCEQTEADLAEGDHDEFAIDKDQEGQAAEDTSETDCSEQNVEVGEASEVEDSSSDGDSDADNGMGRKTGAVRVMVESFADRCVD